MLAGSLRPFVLRSEDRLLMLHIRLHFLGLYWISYPSSSNFHFSILPENSELDSSCFIGRQPSRIFRRCSAICRGTPVISAGLQTKTFRFCLSKAHSSACPFSVRVDPMAIVCSGYSR
ncbi:hypothetical protein Tco_1093115 [Tanacetum coccineum]|uniref:Uncharacterized protein n=1 Tax=Tanacetum coccineum TaxID=301880 RepID=A0ABQ5IE77_9ASTR